MPEIRETQHDMPSERARLTRPVFAHYFAVLADMHRYTISAPTIDEYFALLEQWLWADQYVAAMRAFALDPHPYWPKPGQILERAGVTATDAPTALARASAAILRDGPLMFDMAGGRTLAPIVADALAACGGAVALAALLAAPATQECNPRAELARRFGGVFDRAAMAGAKGLTLPAGAPAPRRVERRGGGLTPIAAVVGEVRP